jgi:hypothetical protein
MRLARHRAVIEANPTPLSDLGIAGALALLTIPGTAEKVVAAAEAAQSVQDKAEAARRQVIFDAIKRNGEAIAPLRERWVPDDYEPRSDPELQKLQQFYDELMETIANNGDEYALAVQCGDYTRAFELVSWAYDLLADMRSMCEDTATRAEAQLNP